MLTAELFGITERTENDIAENQNPRAYTHLHPDFYEIHILELVLFCLYKSQIKGMIYFNRINQGNSMECVMKYWRELNFAFINKDEDFE